MKKYFFLFFIFFVAFSEEKFLKCIFSENDFAIVMLNDATLWKVTSAKVIEQTWNEWWLEKFPKQPEKEYVNNFDDWEPSSKIELYPYEIKNFEAEKYHIDEIFKCDFIMKNLSTNTSAFARKIDLEEFFLELASTKCDCFLGQLKSEYYKGYRDGYVLGYEERDQKEKNH